MSVINVINCCECGSPVAFSLSQIQNELKLQCSICIAHVIRVGAVLGIQGFDRDELINLIHPDNEFEQALKWSEAVRCLMLEYKRGELMKFVDLEFWQTQA